MRRALLALVLVAAVQAAVAHASQLIVRNAQEVSLQVDDKGEALVTYTVAGKVRHVLAWGAIDAIAPAASRRQVAFHLDYSGGYGKYDRSYWRSFTNDCAPYDGPALAWSVAACRAPDGTYWALQAWQRDLPDYGVAPTAEQAAYELHLSHWSGPLPDLWVHTDWSWHRYDHLFGDLEYGGKPVYGLSSTGTGAPLDGFGRLVYVDVYDSVYGSGWRRENSFLTHEGDGVFCYSLNPHGSHPAGVGTRLRVTVEGPGVTPDVMWEGKAPGPYDAAADALANRAIAALGDPLCRPN